MTQSRRALIVGGGIGGLSAAAALRIVGFDVDVFEQSPELREAGSGVALWSNSMSILDQYGAGDTIREKCIPIRKVAVTNASGRQLSCFDLDHLGPGFASMACFVALRPVLLAALGQCVPAKSIHTRRRAVRIETAQDRVRLHLEDGGMEEGDVLVGADGLHSLVRPLVAGSDEVRYSGQTCFRGVARYRAVQPPVLRELQAPGSAEGFAPSAPKPCTGGPR